MKTSIKSKVKAKVAAKTGGIKAKVKGKVAAKCGKCGRGKTCAAVLMAALCAALCGCLGTTTPSRSQTLTISDCTINIFGSWDNGTTNEVARVDIGTQAMAIETSGTENQTVTPTQTTDVKPDINVNYAQGGGITNRGTGGGSAGILESLTADSLKLLKSYVAGKKSGTVTLTKKDGTTVTTDCVNGDCTFSDGTTVTAEECADCELPGWVEPDPVP